MTTLVDGAARVGMQVAEQHETSPAREEQEHGTTGLDDHSSQGSSASQNSRSATLNFSNTDVSHHAFPTSTITEDITPPSSTSSPAKDHSRDAGLDTRANEGASSNIADHKQGPLKVEGGTLVRKSSPPSPLNLGTKRTANGQAKPNEDVEEVRSATLDKTDNGRPRTASSVSNGSQHVNEISQQLRTKLKYAMFKVQNGWQTRSLDEVESLASASPRSVVSGFQHLNDRHSASPRHTLNPKLNRKWSDSSSSESAKSDSHLPTYPASRTSLNPIRPSDASPRGLAPPANIVSGTRRRPSPNEQALHLSTGSQLSSNSPHSVRPGSNKRTPSQNAAMEADAVETLLFMASPNNSGYHPSRLSQESSLRSTQQFSPLRAQFSQTSVTSPKRVAFSDQQHAAPILNKAALIDRELDNMVDSDDSEEQISALAKDRLVS